MAYQRPRVLGVLTVLLVEDNPDDVKLLRRVLHRESGITIVHASRVGEAEERLEEGKFDAVLLDLSLPDSAGLDTVRRVHAAAPNVPIVVLTGTSDADAGLSALHEGAQDYVVKRNMDGQLLDRTLRYAIERQHYREYRALLAREQLARAAAEDELRGRDEFLSVVSHELYTPITALKLSVQSTLQDIRSPGETDRSAIERKLDIVERQTARLGRLVESLLEVSRIQVGRFELVLKEADLARIVADVAAGAEAELLRSRSEVRLHGERSMVGRWDRGRIEQVVTNLLSNAIKYGAGKPIDITVSGDADTATLTVTDHGIGIPYDVQRRIFERFRRAVSTRQYGGLGLGLYVVQRIVSAHGGTVRVESQPGAGSTFTVALPRKLPDGSQDGG